MNPCGRKVCRQSELAHTPLPLPPGAAATDPPTPNRSLTFGAAGDRKVPAFYGAAEASSCRTFQPVYESFLPRRSVTACPSRPVVASSRALPKRTFPDRPGCRMHAPEQEHLPDKGQIYPLNVVETGRTHCRKRLPKEIFGFPVKNNYF